MIKAFDINKCLSVCDLEIMFDDECNDSFDVERISYEIHNSNNKLVSGRSIKPIRYKVGHYYSQWYTGNRPGLYSIVWNYSINGKSYTKNQPFLVHKFEGNEKVIYIDAETAMKLCNNQCNQVFADTGCNHWQHECVSNAYCQPVNTQQCTNKQKHIDISRTAHIQTSVLPLNGSWTSQQQYYIPTGVEYITFYIGYKRNAINGYPSTRIMWGDGVNEFQETVVDSNMHVDNSSSHHQVLSLQELDGPVPVDDSTVNSIIYTKIPGGVKSVRLLAREKGSVSNPGIITVTLTGSGS